MMAQSWAENTWEITNYVITPTEYHKIDTTIQKN